MNLVEICLVILTTFAFWGLFHFNLHRKHSRDSDYIVLQKLRDIHEVLEKLKGK